MEVISEPHNNYYFLFEWYITAFDGRGLVSKTTKSCASVFDC